MSWVYLLNVNQLNLHNYDCYHRIRHREHSSIAQVTSMKNSVERTIYFLNAVSCIGEILKWKKKYWIHPKDHLHKCEEEQTTTGRDIKKPSNNHD